MALSAFATQTVLMNNAGTAAVTITIAGVAYTLRAAVGTTVSEVKIGANATATAQNLFDAVNNTPAQSGVTFGSNTVRNPEARALKIVGATVTLTAGVPGVIGNRITLATSSATDVTVGGATFASGSGSLDADLLGNLNTMQMPASVAEVFKKIVTGTEVAPS